MTEKTCTEKQPAGKQYNQKQAHAEYETVSTTSSMYCNVSKLRRMQTYILKTEIFKTEEDEGQTHEQEYQTHFQVHTVLPAPLHITERKRGEGEEEGREGRGEERKEE